MSLSNKISLLVVCGACGLTAPSSLIAQAPEGVISVAGIQLNTESLSFEGSLDGLSFTGSGSTDFEFADQSLELLIPDGGVVVVKQGDSWSLQAMTAQVVADIELYGLELAVDEDNPLTVAFESDSNAFSFYGDVSLSVEDQTVSGFLGTESLPGLVLVNGTLDSYDLGVSESISLSGLEISTTGDFLGIAYHSDSDTYAIFGGLSVSFDSQSVAVTAGDSESPGVLLTVDNRQRIQLDSLNATVTEDLSLFGLELKTGDDGLTFQYDRDGDLYEVFGELDLEIEGDTLDALLGDEESPGLLISGGEVQALNLGVATDFNVGGFEFKSPDDNPFTVTYERSSDTYTLSGTAELDSLWDTTIELGSADHPGIIIENNRWDIEDLAIEIDRLDLGFAQLKELRVAYDRTDDGDIDVEVDLDVSIPELEIEVTGDVRVENGKITDIFTDFKAVGTSEGLEILDTGIDIAELAVSLENLDQPANLILSGMIGMEFGGQLSIGGRTVTLAYIEGDVYIDADELRLSDSIFYGAYEKDNGDWTSVIYKGDAVLDLNWSEGVYSIDGDIQLPTDYGVKISESLRFTTEQIVMQAKAEVRVPDGIPLIGGDNLGSIDADMLINMRDSTKSFAAGWVSIDLLFTTECAGIKYKFHSGDIDYIGSGEIGDIKDEIKDAESADDLITKHFTVDVPEGATSFVMDFDWSMDPFPGFPSELEGGIPEVFVSATGSLIQADGSVGQGPLSLHQLNYDNGSGYLALPDDLVDVVVDSKGITFSSEGLVLSALPGQELAFLALTEGEVQVSVSYDRAIDPLVTIETPTLSFYYDYADPSISLNAVKTDETNSETEGEDTSLFSGTKLPVELGYFTDPAFAVGATISLFLDKNAKGYNGHRIGGPWAYTNTSVTDPATRTRDWTVENVYGDPNGAFYFYAGIDNGSQPVVYTDYVGPFRINPAIYGTVFEANQLIPADGFRVYLDANGNDRYDSGEDPSTITDSKGFYALDNVDEGEVAVGVVIPKGYISNDEKLDLVKRNYVSGDSLVVDFNVLQLTTISGVVFTDSNENGVQEEGEPGMFGVMLYLDEDDDGGYTPGRDVTAMSDIEGHWAFNGVDPGELHTVHVLGFPSQLTTEVTEFTVDTSTSGNNRIVRAMASDEAFKEFGGHNIPVRPHAVEEIADKRYMIFAKRFFDGLGESHLLGADPDQDGLGNDLERLLGRDPTAAEEGSIFELGPADDETFEIIMEQVDQHRYRIEVSSDLERWREVDRFRATFTGPSVLRFQSAELGETAFVRVRVED